MQTLQVDDELDCLDAMVGLDQQHIIELGCGAAALARQLLTRFPRCQLTALEVMNASMQKICLPRSSF